MAKRKSTGKKKKKGPAYRSPEYMRLLGRRRWKNISAEKRKEALSEIAKLSHPSNNPEAQRDGYHGGRKAEV